MASDEKPERASPWQWLSSQRQRRVLLGAMTIVAMIVGVLFSSGMDRQVDAAAGGVDAPSWKQVLLSERALQVELNGFVPASSNVPVFARDENGTHHLVGWLGPSDVGGQASNNASWKLHWIDRRFTPMGTQAEYYESPETLAWVAETLLPPEKRAAMIRSFVARFEQYRDRLVADLEPLVVDSLRDIVPILQERLQEAIRKRQPMIEVLALKYEETLVRQKLIPLIQEEVIPIVRKESEPLLLKIGEELFERASVWSFTWRYLYDVSPLPQRNLVQREFARFVAKDAEPVIASHSNEILAVTKKIMQELVANEAIRSTSREVAAELFHDPMLRQLISESLTETFADAEPMRQAMRKRWESEQGQRFLFNLQQMMEPWFRELGAELFGTPQDGLTKELVAVLRTQILSKDKQWLVVPCTMNAALTSPVDSLRLTPGTQLPAYPLADYGSTK